MYSKVQYISIVLMEQCCRATSTIVLAAYDDVANSRTSDRLFWSIEFLELILSEFRSQISYVTNQCFVLT